MGKKRLKVQVVWQHRRHRERDSNRTDERERRIKWIFVFLHVIRFCRHTRIHNSTLIAFFLETKRSIAYEMM